MVHVIYPVVAGPVPTTITTSFNCSTDVSVTVTSTSYIPDAPNIITITDDTDHFVTFKYGELERFPIGGELSDIEYIEGDLDFPFPVGSTIVRALTKYDIDTIHEILSIPTVGGMTINGSSQTVSDRIITAVIDKSTVGLSNVDNTTDLNKPISNLTQAALDNKTNVVDFNAHTTNKSNPHDVTKLQVGLGNVDNTSDADKPVSTAVQTELDLKADVADLAEHIADDDNPHSVTKAQVGLGNADNTADLDKPISTLTQAALDLKATAADLESHVEDVDNPHSVTKSQVGLGNVDNTSDLDKPISTLTQTALNAKVDKVEGKSLSENDYTDEDKAIVDAVTGNLATKVDKETGMGLSQNSYTDAEKTKLAGIAAGAEVNVQADWTKTDTTDDSYIKNKPTALKNPYPVKFTGAVTSQYDGSAEVTVNIPDSATWGNINGNLTDQTDLVTKFGTKQDTIDSTHKLSADLVQETTTNKFNVQADWNATSGDAVILNKPSSLEPDTHASTHEEGGTDELELSESQITGLVQDLSEKATQTSLDSHTSDTDNPHEVTKAQVGLPNVVDGAQINVIESISKNGVAQTIVNKNVNLELSKTDVGLGNVDNTSDTTKADTAGNPVHDKIETKAPISHASSDTTYGVASATNYGHPKATSSAPSNATLTAAVGTDNGQYARADHSHAKETFTMDGFPITKRDWVADSTYSNFPYKATISNQYISSSHIPIVILSNDDAVFGNVSKNAMTSNGSLTLYAKVAMSCVVSKVVFVKE